MKMKNNNNNNKADDKEEEEEDDDDDDDVQQINWITFVEGGTLATTLMDELSYIVYMSS
eukprot:gene8005-726_t